MDTSRTPARGRRAAKASLAAALLAAAILGSCAGAPEAARPAPAAAPAGPRPIAGWESLPEPARDFAREFSRRVEAGDWAWIASRADPQFAAANGLKPGRAPDGLVLARLVRAGAYADSFADEYAVPTPLPLEATMRAVVDETKARGPIAILYGRFLVRGKADIPFSLRLAWQLDEPRILGLLR